MKQYILIHKNTVIATFDDLKTAEEVMHKVLPPEGKDPLYLVEVLKYTESIGEKLQAIRPT